MPPELFLYAQFISIKYIHVMQRTFRTCKTETLCPLKDSPFALSLAQKLAKGVFLIRLFSGPGERRKKEIVMEKGGL